MYDLIEKWLDEPRSDMEGYAKKPAANKLFKMNPGCKKLTESHEQLFHNLVSKCCIYVNERDKKYRL